MVRQLNRVGRKVGLMSGVIAWLFSRCEIRVIKN